MRYIDSSSIIHASQNKQRIDFRLIYQRKVIFFSCKLVNPSRAMNDALITMQEIHTSMSYNHEYDMNFS